MELWEQALDAAFKREFKKMRAQVDEILQAEQDKADAERWRAWKRYAAQCDQKVQHPSTSRTFDYDAHMDAFIAKEREGK